MNKLHSFPQIILLNGASSSGKSTLAKEVIRHLPYPCFYYSSDLLVDGGMIPSVDRLTPNTPSSWNIIRPKFFEGFHRSIPSFIEAGNAILVEHIVEKKEWFDDLVQLLEPFSVLYVGVHCAVEEIDRRERVRGNRIIGEGRSHIEDGIHTWSAYDVELFTDKNSIDDNIQLILEAVNSNNVEQSVFRKSARIK